MLTLSKEQHTVWICYFFSKDGGRICLILLWPTLFTTQLHRSPACLSSACFTLVTLITYSRVMFVTVYLWLSLGFFFFSVVFWRFLLLLSSLSLFIRVLCLLSISVWQTGGCVAQVLLAPGSCGRLFLHIIILLLFHTLCTRTVDFRVGLEITLELQK